MFYSISDLETYSGIKAHTIRIWEQRYGILTPHRTETNIRYYDDAQLRHLLNVSSLVKAGYRISKISKMSEDEIFEKITEAAALSQTEDTKYRKSQNALLSAALEFDEQRFDKAFSHCMLRFGIEETYMHVVIPVLNRVGLLWRKEQMHPGQEHFMSCLIRQKLFTAIDGVTTSEQSEQHWLLFLPEKEEHDIGLIFANYLLRQFGKRVTYLGQRVPTDSVISVLEQVTPTHLLMFISGTMDTGAVQKYLASIADAFSNQEAFVAGPPFLLDQLEMPDGLTKLGSVDDLTSVIAEPISDKSHD